MFLAPCKWRQQCMLQCMYLLCAVTQEREFHHSVCRPEGHVRIADYESVDSSFRHESKIAHSRWRLALV